MTTNKEIEYALSYLVVEAYLAGLSTSTMPLHFTPGNKTQGNSPRIAHTDGTVPSYIPTLELSDSNKMVMTKLNATTNVFFAFRQRRQDEQKAAKELAEKLAVTGGWHSSNDKVYVMPPSEEPYSQDCPKDCQNCSD